MHGCVVVSGMVTSSPSAMIPQAVTFMRENHGRERRLHKVTCTWTWSSVSVLKSVQFKFMSQLWLHLSSPVEFMTGLQLCCYKTSTSYEIRSLVFCWIADCWNLLFFALNNHKTKSVFLALFSITQPVKRLLLSFFFLVESLKVFLCQQALSLFWQWSYFMSKITQKLVFCSRWNSPTGGTIHFWL